jgi:hypothetical protein
MITNIPTPENLNDVALRLYFSAWSSLVGMRAEFEDVFVDDPTGNEWREEWTDYLVACQPELQSICTLIQQSNELALKAKICSVSPFLLLLRSDAKLSTSPKDVDFSEFKTLDAVELPGAVNTFCKEHLSDKFIQTYHEVRSLRNRISHLGQLNKQLLPDELTRILLFQYAELWPGRAWLNDRVRYASATRRAFFHDGKYATAEMEVMYELYHTFRMMTGAEFKRLFGHPKNTRRYLCHECIYEASTRNFDLGFSKTCKTAFLDKSGHALECLMCTKKFKVARQRCSSPECKGNVIGDNDDDYIGKCHVCGEGGE